MKVAGASRRSKIASKRKRMLIHTQQKTNRKRKWGFADKTGWDWLNLIGVLHVPLMIGVFTIVSSIQQGNITADQQQETELETYLDKMSDLLTSRDFNDPVIGSEIRLVVQSRTLTVLKRLDSPRIAIVLRFLIQSSLILKGHPIISLSSFVLTQPDLTGIDLSEADLSGANLTRAILHDANLFASNLVDINLSGADLSETDMMGAVLSGANLSGANLDHAILRDAIVTNEQLAQAASLHGAILPDGSTHP